MKFNIASIPATSYLEVGQVNPLRWVVLFRESQTDFSCQTGKVKCKDFFNDNLAFFKHGVNFNMYGYQAQAKKNDEGMYFLLLNINKPEVFMHNLDVMNAKLKEQLGCEVPYFQQSDDKMVILLPNPLWENTWRMSLVTILIRCSNYGYKHETWEDFFDPKAPLTAVDHVFDALTIKNTKAWGFQVPDTYKDMWFYCGKDYNSKKQPKQTGGTIHNNGCCNWSYFLSQEGVKA